MCIASRDAHHWFIPSLLPVIDLSRTRQSVPIFDDAIFDRINATCSQLICPLLTKFVVFCSLLVVTCQLPLRNLPSYFLIGGRFIFFNNIAGSCWCRREQKYQEKLALKKAQRRAAESAQEKAERKKNAKLDGTAAHFGLVERGCLLLDVFI